MKKLFTLLLFISPLLASAQSYSGPESVEYDTAYNRWLVGNHNNGTVLALSPGSGTLTPFASGMSNGPYGIEILDTVLYCCIGGTVRGFDLATGTQVFNVNVGATFLNGICSDGVSNLFLTDFSGKKIYRLNVVTGNYNVMVSGLAKSPNGMVYDGANNRCVFVNWGTSAPIMAMSLADSSTSTLVTSTLSNIDGIAHAPSGNWYVSAWGNNALSRFNSTFTGGSTVVMPGLTSPADLGINAAGDSIAIPNSGTANNVRFYYICTATTLISAFTSNANGPIVQFTDATTGGTPASYAWDFGDGGTSTLPDPSHTYAGAGTYNVCLIVTDACGSDTTCDSVTVTATALDESALNHQLICYPNPAKEFLLLQSSYSTEADFYLLNVQGIILRKEMIAPGAEKIISLEGLAEGIYLGEWRNSKGERIAGGKIVVY